MARWPPRPSFSWQLAAGSLTDPEEIDRLRTALRLYCHRDTLAMF